MTRWIYTQQYNKELNHYIGSWLEDPASGSPPALTDSFCVSSTAAFSADLCWKASSNQSSNLCWNSLTSYHNIKFQISYVKKWRHYRHQHELCSYMYMDHRYRAITVTVACNSISSPGVVMLPMHPLVIKIRVCKYKCSDYIHVAYNEVLSILP